MSYADNGFLLLESDDGGKGSINYWLPLLSSKRQPLDHFPFSRSAVGAVGICLGLTGMMTQTEVLTLQRNGWEVQNHGRTHSSIAAHALTAPASAGATRMYVNYVNMINYNRSFASATYVVTNGGASQTVTINNKNSTEGWVEFTEPLASNYPSGASFRMSASTIEDEVNTHLDDLLDKGYRVANYSASFVMGDSVSVTKVAERHNSGRLATGLYNVNPPVMENLACYNFTGYTTSHFNTWLAAVKSSKTLGILYGHSEPYESGSLLDYILNKAIELGIPIITRQEAIERLGGVYEVPPSSPSYADGKATMRVRHLIDGQEIVIQRSLDGTTYSDVSTALSSGEPADGVWSAEVDVTAYYRAAFTSDAGTVYSNPSYIEYIPPTSEYDIDVILMPITPEPYPYDIDVVLMPITIGLPIYIEGKQVLEIYVGGKRVTGMSVGGKVVF